MNFKFPVTIALLLFLTFQLSTTRVDFSVPTYSFGEYLTKIFKERAPNFSFAVRPAQYTAQAGNGDSLIFVGDVLLARNIEFLMMQNGAQYPYGGLSFSEFGKNPKVIGNFESSIPRQHVPTPIKQIDFSTDKKYVPAFRKAGFTHVSLANNHSLDFGTAEFSYTVETLEANGVETFGHQTVLSNQSVEFIELNEVMVAIIGIHTLHRLPTYSELQEVFKFASQRSDFQIVYVHWGSEYKMVHNTRQREAAERFIDAGADLVVGHHPHVVQDIQLINDVPVFYSLGNYIFDQYDSVTTQQGLVLHLDFSELRSISLLPVSSEQKLSQPAMMSKEKHTQFLLDLAKRSDLAARDYILSGFFPLDVPVASSSKMAIMSK